MKKVEERTNKDLLELALQLHSRSSLQPGNKEIHEAAIEAREELERRLNVLDIVFGMGIQIVN